MKFFFQYSRILGKVSVLATLTLGCAEDNSLNTQPDEIKRRDLFVSYTGLEQDGDRFQLPARDGNSDPNWTDIRVFPLSIEVPEGVTSPTAITIYINSVDHGEAIGQVEVKFSSAGDTNPDSVLYPADRGARHIPSGASAVEGGFWLACSKLRSIQGNAGEVGGPDTNIVLSIKPTANPFARFRLVSQGPTKIRCVTS